MSEMLAIKVVEGDLTRQGNGMKAVKMAKPVPGSGEVLVKMKLRPVNPADVFSSMGVYPGFPLQEPCIPGLEGMGVVEAYGPNTSGKLAPGTRVTAWAWGLMKGSGAYAEFCVIPEEDLIALPDDVSDEAGAVMAVNPITVIGMFEDANVKKGDTLLVTAAASALGRMAIAYGKDQGIKVIATVRRDAQKQELLDLGATAVINTASEDMVARVNEVTGGKGADAALECILGDVVAA